MAKRKSRQSGRQDLWKDWAVNDTPQAQVDYLAPTLQQEFDKSMKCMRCPEPIMAEANCQDCKLETEELEEFILETVDYNQLVTEIDGRLVTNSLLVAGKFGKEHKNVMRDIRNLTAQNGAVKNMFVETDYVNSRGQVQPMFVMNRDGFSLLVMGFTGSEALKFKIEFIEAFNKMEAFIKEKLAAPITGDYLMLVGQRMKELELKIELDKPKVAFAETVNTNKRAITMQEFSKILFDKNGIDIGRNDLLYNNLSPSGIYFIYIIMMGNFECDKI